MSGSISDSQVLKLNYWLYNILLCQRLYLGFELLTIFKGCQWWIQDFPQGDAPTAKSVIIFQIFAENCMKMKEFGPPPMVVFKFNGYVASY